MPISMRRYVDIASAVVGAGGAAMQKMDARLFTDHPDLFSQQLLEFSEAGEVANYFGNSSNEAKFASQYFALTTPAPVSRARAIQFAPHLVKERQATIYGSTDHADMAALKQLSTAAIAFTLDGVDITGVADFSGETTFTEVAGEISSIQALIDAGISVQYMNGAFVAKGPHSLDFDIVYTADMASLGLSYPGAVRDAGGGKQTMLDAWQSAEDKNPSYGSCFFLDQQNYIDDPVAHLDECVAVAEANAALNVMHQLYIQVKRKDATDFHTALGGTASVGLILETPEEPYVAHIPMALMSATDYGRANATMNYMFRSPGVTIQPQVDSTLVANELDPKRVNYYGQTAVAGSPIQFFQRAFLCGPASAPLDMSVHANEQWLKARFTALWFDLLTQTRGIPANLDGKARANLIIADVVKEALRNGVILRGKELTPTQKVAVTDAAGGDPIAWMTVQNDGAWYDVQIKTRTDEALVESYYLDYVLVYAKGDWVRKITASHNLT